MKCLPAEYVPPENLWPEFTEPEEFADTPEHLNLTDFLLDRHIREGRGSCPAVKTFDRVVSYSELQTSVNRFGNALKSAGAEARDRVGIRLVNSLEAVVAIFAIEKIGAVPVPTSPLWAHEELAYVVNDAEMKFLIAHAPLMDAVDAARSLFEYDVRVIVIGGDPEKVGAAGDLSFEAMSAEGSPLLEPEMLSGRDVGIILYTSGTTALPKGCAHFVRPIVTETRIVNRCVYRLAPGDVLGGAAPISFAAGFGTFTLMPFEGGAAVSLIPRFNPGDLMDLVQRHGITVLTGVPTAYRALMKLPDFKKYDLGSIRLFTSGADSLGAETLRAWKELTGRPIWEGLAATEMLHLITSNTMNPEPVPNSIGKPLPGVKIRVIDAEGKDCRPGEIGSLMVKGPCGTLYWKPHANGGRLLSAQKESVVDGWNHLGDAVYWDNDGNLFFVSREDDVIKSSGYRISPVEIEEAIAKHPAVSDVGVVGVPDEDRGQSAKAVIVLHPGHIGNDEFTGRLLDFLKGRIAAYKLPRIVEYVDRLPRTPTGKLLRRKLRD